MTGETLALALLAGAKWMTDLGIVWLVGVSGFRMVAVRGAGAGAALDRRLAAQAGLALALLLAATAARLWAQTYSSFGLDEPVTGELIRLVAEQTRWGGRWVLQAGAVVLVTPVAAVLLARRGPIWAIFGLVTLGVVGTAPLTGHAMANAGGVVWPMVLQVLHLLAAGVWLGTLGVLLTAGLRALGQPDGAEDGASVSRLVDSFSPVALAAATTVAVTGGLTAVLYVDQIAQLWQSTYGRALLLKTTLFLVTAGLGAYNWKRVRPRLTDAGGVARLRRSGTAELLVAVLLLAVTAWLVHLPMPGD